MKRYFASTVLLSFGTTYGRVVCCNNVTTGIIVLANCNASCKFPFGRINNLYYVIYNLLPGGHSWLGVDEPESADRQHCPQKDLRPELDCRPHIRAALANLSKSVGAGGNRGGSSGGKNTMENGIYKDSSGKQKKKIKSKDNEEEMLGMYGMSVSTPTWKTEYQDVIGETGQAVMKEKIHHFGKMSVGRRKLLAFC